jgi:hypothetical protein
VTIENLSVPPPGARLYFTQVGASGGHCDVLEGNVKPTDWRVRGRTDYTGTLTLDCQTPDGGRVRGSVQFAHGH